MTTVSIALIFPIAFIVLWVFISWLLSALGGWSSLAAHYGISSTPDNIQWFRWKSMALSRIKIFPVNYNNCLKMAFDETGMYLSPLIIFRIGHTTLKLPYQDMNVEIGPFFFWEAARISMINKQNLRIVLIGRSKKLFLENYDAR